uniref:protein-tyrosine-phosphatase n=1 Tax=Sinocyclocheilus rhinocerous TaxID=307959 RepID=A0A673LVV5_9TELE
PENKDKNRFSNVLLTSAVIHYTRHYLACISRENVPGGLTFVYCLCAYQGYANASRQYIAAQGPLPSTVNDFWRMVWEKRSQVIVMVTNCTESGRVRQCSEQKTAYCCMKCLLTSILVSCKVLHTKTTSETRTVRHFHFTAWPDHGVPTGTEELIQFRGRIRQHVESSFSAGPTIVHCSAGVGRTGTLIALDVLLQQLDKEKAVGISAFVQQMRLSRPLMVQTEVRLFQSIILKSIYCDRFIGNLA